MSFLGMRRWPWSDAAARTESARRTDGWHWDGQLRAVSREWGMQQSLSERLASIVLPDCDERLVRLGSLWEDGPTVLVFLRHYG